MMRRIVDIAVSHARLTIAILIFLLAAGALAYNSIPKESTPDIQIPIIYVQLSERGISPEDSERLLLRPMETALKTVANIKTMRSAGFEGGGYVLMEFDAGFNADVALRDVRAKVDGAKPNLPTDVDAPGVFEVNLSLFPVISVALSGDISERTLGKIARDLQNSIKEAPGVLSADLRGTRDEVVEIIAEPMLLKSYGVDLGQFAFAAAQGNSLVAAGDLEGTQGSFGIKVPALIETPEDVLNIPVAASNAASVTLGDVATILPTFKDAISITRVNGKPAVVIDVSKRTGANLIATADGVKAAVAAIQKTWPESIKVQFIGDQSKFIVDLTTLQSDDSRRDNYVRRNALDTARFPAAEFVLREVRGLAAPLPASGPAQFQLVGDMTVHGVTSGVVWDVTATFTAGGATGKATTKFPFSQFAMQIPRVFLVVSLEDNIRLELDFRLAPAG